MRILFLLFISCSAFAKTASEIVDTRPVGHSATFDQNLIELLSKPYNHEKVALLKKYGILGEKKGLSENYYNAKNRYSTITVKRDPQGNLMNIIRAFPTNDGIQTELLNVPKKSITMCGFSLKGKPTGCYTQSQYVCTIMGLRNREQYMLDQVAALHREGVTEIQRNLPGSYKSRVRKHAREFAKIKNSMDPADRGPLTQVCQNQIAAMDHAFAPVVERMPASVPEPVVDSAAALPPGGK